MITQFISGSFSAHLTDTGKSYNIYREINGSGVFIGSMADRSQFELFNTQSMDFTDWACLHRVINKCFEQFK